MLLLGRPAGSSQGGGPSMPGEVGRGIFYITFRTSNITFGRPVASVNISLRYTGVRPPGADKFAISMGNAQEGAWLLVIPPSYPHQTLPNICVQSRWPSQARDACAKTPVPRRDFLPFLTRRAPLMAFSSKELLHLDTNDWR